MPAIDDARRRIRMSAQHADALGAIAMNRDITDDTTRRARDELVTAGILDSGYRFHPLAADLARALMAPTFEFVIEQVGPQGASMCSVVVRNEDVWSYDPWPNPTPDTEMVYSREELPTLIWTLARLVGLRRSHPPTGAEPMAATLGLVDAVMFVFQEAGPDDWSTVKTVAMGKANEHAAHLPEADRKRWVATIASLISFWRITTRWADPGAEGGQRFKTLAVLDCGSEGHWKRDLEGGETVRLSDVTPETPLHLTPKSGGELWKELQHLLPTGDELRAAYANSAA